MFACGYEVRGFAVDTLLLQLTKLLILLEMESLVHICQLPLGFNWKEHHCSLAGTQWERQYIPRPKVTYPQIGAPPLVSFSRSMQPLLRGSFLPFPQGVLLQFLHLPRGLCGHGHLLPGFHCPGGGRVRPHRGSHTRQGSTRCGSRMSG
jgi:hypothetical protein